MLTILRFIGQLDIMNQRNLDDAKMLNVKKINLCDKRILLNFEKEGQLIAGHFPLDKHGKWFDHNVQINTDYENLLAPVVNASCMLRSKLSGPQESIPLKKGINYLPFDMNEVLYVFRRPEKESSGEKDYETKDHKFDIDFKLFESQSLFKAVSYVSPSFRGVQNDNFSSYTISDKSKREKDIEKGNNKKLDHFSFIEHICYGDKFCRNSDNQRNEKDKNHIKKILRSQYNLILLYPNYLEFVCNQDISFEKEILKIVDKLNEIFYSAFAYREKEASVYSTFFMFMTKYFKPSRELKFSFCLLELKDGLLDKEYIELIEAPEKVNMMFSTPYSFSTPFEIALCQK